MDAWWHCFQNQFQVPGQRSAGVVAELKNQVELRSWPPLAVLTQLHTHPLPLSHVDGWLQPRLSPQQHCVLDYLTWKPGETDSAWYQGPQLSHDVLQSQRVIIGLHSESNNALSPANPVFLTHMPILKQTILENSTAHAVHDTVRVPRLKPHDELAAKYMLIVHRHQLLLSSEHHISHVICCPFSTTFPPNTATYQLPNSGKSLTTGWQQDATGRLVATLPEVFSFKLMVLSVSCESCITTFQEVPYFIRHQGRSGKKA